MFLISLTAISALGVIAGGAFWSAQSMYRVTQGGTHAVEAKLCLPGAPKGLVISTGDPKFPIPVHACPH